MQRTSIRESSCDIHWIEIHLVDRIIYLLNKWRQKSYHTYPHVTFSSIVKDFILKLPGINFKNNRYRLIT